MERDFKGIWIPKEIWLNKFLNVNEKIFLVEIDSLDNENGCFASNDYFSEFFRLSKNRCSEIIKSLEKKGLLTISYQYMPGTKSIDKRIIKVIDISTRGIRKVDGGIRELDGGIRELERGYSENREDNNTILNNTINNTINKDISKDISSSTKVQPIIEKWNGLGLQKIIAIKPGSNRYKLLNARINDLGQEQVLQAIENISGSSFLKGQNDRNWIITFDWLIKPNNFIKVLEGNYSDKNKPVQKTNEAKPLRFNNFEGRQYDYNDLENKLLGWDK